MASQLPIDIVVDETTLSQARRDLAGMPGAIDRALTAAVNKAVIQGRTIVVDGVFAVLNTKRKAILDRVHVRKARKGNPVAKVIAGKNRIGLANFGARDTTDRSTHTGQGVFVQIFKSGGQKNYARAFIANYRGNKEVVQRKEGTALVSTGRRTWYGSSIKKSIGTGTLVGRLPLIQKVGPSPAEVLREQPKVEQESRAKIAAVLREQVLSQVDRVLKRSRQYRPADEQ